MPTRFAFPLTVLAACAGVTLIACSNDDGPATVPTAAARSVGSLKLIGQQIVPRRTVFNGTTIGGLSSIDYDAANHRYLMISDDRTTTDSSNAPRMYTASLSFDATSFGQPPTFLSTFPMLQPDGSTYPKRDSANNATDGNLLVADPESVRIDPVSGNLVWVSEGERTLGTSSQVQRLINPFVREITPAGVQVRQYAVPTMFDMSAGSMGPNNNLVFEGIAFTPDTLSTVVITEGPLMQDGPLPTTTSGAVSRITVYDRASGNATAQYAYPIDPIQAQPSPAGSFALNGPSEILAVTNTRFLVLERSFSVGVADNQIRLYEIDTAAATNVLNTLPLAGARYTPVTKRLILNFEDLKATLGNTIANLEGLTFGPKLGNGHDSLVVVADDNFPTSPSSVDFNQFLVFDVIPQ